jgi:hypothetical protein|tara:strand:+ start:55 stop:393 length:339 start_codon:yes stop_codon:yes gene_type:complete
MYGHLVAALVGVSTVLYVHHKVSTPKEESLPQENTQELAPAQTPFAKSVRDSISIERNKVNADYWGRWKRENIVTMDDKMYDYQMKRYKMWEDGEISRFRWNNAVLAPRDFY